MEVRSKRRKTQALSTGQAARFCYVTSETILNWIRGNRLRAQRTAGGQYRIPVDELREFMKANGMETGLLETERGVRPYCWEFHCQMVARYGGFSGTICADCLVRRSGTLNCWKLHGLLAVTRRHFDNCEECEYRRAYEFAKEDDG